MSDNYIFRRKMMVGGKLGEAKLFIDEVMARNASIKIEDVRLALRVAQMGDKAEFPKDATASYITAVKSIAAVAKQAYSKAEQYIQEQKKKEVEESAKKVAYKEKCIEVYKSTDSTAIAKPMSDMVGQSVALALGSHFIMDGGDITIKDNQDPLESFSSGFKNLNDLYYASSELQDGFATYEAKLALAAKKIMGSEWPMSLAGATKKEIIRIRKNMWAVDKFQQLGISTDNIPIMTMRVLTEIRYSEDDAINKKLLKDTIDKFLEKSHEKGSPLTQAEARDLVRGVKNKKPMKSLWDFFYLTIVDGAITVKGSMGLSDEEFDRSTMVIDRKGCVVITKDPDGYQQDDIPTIIGGPSEKAVAKQVKEQKARPEPVAAVVPAPEPEPTPVPEPTPAPEAEPAPPLAEVIPFPQEAEPEEEQSEDDLDDIFRDLV